MTAKLTIKNLAALPEVVRQFVTMLTLPEQNNEIATVIGLVGNLGAGKTTFVQELALELGVKDRVQSPTFTILKTYQTTHPLFKQLIHMDAYRIESLAELEPLRFQELLNSPETLFCIEWPEKIAPALPAHYELKLETVSEEERVIVVTKVEKSQT
jgi:tRNA threonylcarbamoyladenosine biosynthesis protein TsaE